MPARLQEAIICPARVTPTKRRLAWSPDAGQRTLSPWSNPEAERLAQRRAGWRYYASPAPLDAKPPPARPVTKPTAPVVTPRRRKTPRRTKPELRALEKKWVHHGSRHAPIVDRPPPRRPLRGPVDDRRVARAMKSPPLLQRLKVGFGPTRRLSPARRDDRRSWFCDRPRGRRLLVQGRRARVVAPARAALCKSFRFRSRPRRLSALPRVGRPREPPLRGRDARGTNYGFLESCWHVH